MKIKTKKQFTLPQLIEWLLKSGYRNYTANSNMGNIVTLSRYGAIQFSHGTFFPEETFTVEVEEVVDSDAVLDNIYTVNVEVGNSHTTYYKSKSINDVKTDEINIVYTILQEEAIVLWDSQGGFR